MWKLRWREKEREQAAPSDPGGLPGVVPPTNAVPARLALGGRRRRVAPCGMRGPGPCGGRAGVRYRPRAAPHGTTPEPDNTAER